MKDKEYLLNYHCFWNWELKYVFENRNVNHYIHLDFLVHILKYWTMEEIKWFYLNDKYTFTFLKDNLNFIFYKTNKERLFRNNKDIFNWINNILNQIWITPMKDIIYNNTEVEKEILYDKKIQKMADFIIKTVEEDKKKKNDEKIKKILSKK